MYPVFIPPTLPSLRPSSNPPYLLHQKVPKARHPACNSSTNSRFPSESRARTCANPQKPDNSWVFTDAFDHNMKLLTHKALFERVSSIRSPKQLLSSMKTREFAEKPKTVSSKREILAKTGALNSANLKKLMNFCEETAVSQETHYSLKNAHFRNYKYGKPNSFYQQIFRSDAVSAKKTRICAVSLENCIENIKKNAFKGCKTAKNWETLENKPRDARTNGQSLELVQEISEEIREFLAHSPRVPRISAQTLEEEPFLLDISNISKRQAPKVLRKPGFLAKKLREFAAVSELSKKSLQFLERSAIQVPENVKKAVFEQNFLLVCALKRSFSGFLSRNSLINERILLALGINARNPVSLVSKKAFKTLTRLFFAADQGNSELIEFCVRFFVGNDEGSLEKDEFFRVLKVLTQEIDEKLASSEKKKSLFENFLENFYMVRVLQKNANSVDFARFREVYGNYQMNIYDLVDLIFGRA